MKSASFLDFGSFFFTIIGGLRTGKNDETGGEGEEEGSNMQESHESWAVDYTNNLHSFHRECSLEPLENIGSSPSTLDRAWRRPKKGLLC